MSDDVNKDDPFAEFEDWLVDGPAGEWPQRNQAIILSARQRQIAGSNAELLGSSDKFFEKLNRLSKLIDAQIETDRPALSKKYEVRFDSATFPKPVSFRDVTIPCGITFLNCKFEDSFSIFNCEIFGNVRIDGSIINGMVFLINGCLFFNGNIFADELKSVTHTFLIQRNTFSSGSIYLWKVELGAIFCDLSGNSLDEGEIRLIGADLSRCRLIAHDLRLNGGLRLNGSVIAAASFKGSRISGESEFDNVKFGSIPDFRNVQFDYISDVARIFVPGPELTHSVEPKERTRRNLTATQLSFGVASKEQDVLKLRKLKAMALAANDHEKDGEFFAYEMMAKRGVEHTTFWQLLFNTIYWKVSFYGQSYLRPLGWLAASYLGFATHYVWWLQRYVPAPDAAHFAWWFSLKNTIPFLVSLFRFAPAPEGHVSRFDQVFAQAAEAGLNVDAVIQTGVFQSVLGAVFLFFLLLGLRNKFRLK